MLMGSCMYLCTFKLNKTFVYINANTKGVRLPTVFLLFFLFPPLSFPLLFFFFLSCNENRWRWFVLLTELLFYSGQSRTPKWTTCVSLLCSTKETVKPRSHCVTMKRIYFLYWEKSCILLCFFFLLKVGNIMFLGSNTSRLVSLIFY